MSKTAVEWFWEQLPEILPFSLDTETAVKLQEAKEQAKAMERNQIIEAVQEGYDIDRSLHKWKRVALEYYKETYGKEASNEEHS